MDDTEKEADPPIATVTILAGIPGSGKSTWAKDSGLREILSTDDFWTKDGEYLFDYKRITEAHGWNFRRFLANMAGASMLREQGNIQCPSIVIDNTNTTIAEIAPYYAAAQAYGADVRILAIVCPWQVAAERQRHGLPYSKVYQMHLRFEETMRNIPSWWRMDVKVHG